MHTWIAERLLILSGERVPGWWLSTDQRQCMWGPIILAGKLPQCSPWFNRSLSGFPFSPSGNRSSLLVHLRSASRHNLPARETVREIGSRYFLSLSFHLPGRARLSIGCVKEIEISQRNNQKKVSALRASVTNPLFARRPSELQWWRWEEEGRKSASQVFARNFSSPPH